MPDGARVHYDRISSGTLWLDAVYEATSTPTVFYKSRITWNGDGWDLKLKDGTLYVFPEAFSPSRPSQCALLRVQDRLGNILSLTRDANKNLIKITTPNNRWVEFTYDSSYRITQAKDNISRIVTYTYDSSGRLWKVTDPNNGVTEYTYDSSHRMLTVKDARGIVYLTNEYDTNGRVSKQTLADDTPGSSSDNPTYQFSYTTDSGGRIVQTDVTDPRGNIRRVTFNSDGYRLTDTSAVGRPEQQGVSLERQAGTNFVQAIIDPLGRRSEYSFDSMGNVLSATNLAGTSAAATTNFVYEPTFNEVTSITDPLTRTTSYSYDSKGNLTKITDPLNHETTLAYNAAGQVISATDPLQHTVQFVYDSGDLVQVRDPLNRTLSLFLDSAGRLRRVTDAIGNATRYDYDSLNQVTKVIEQLGGVTEFAYDPNGNLLSVKDALNQITSFTYDSMDRALTRTDPLQGSTSVERYEYDLGGNPTKVTDRRGKVTSLSYDGLDRPTFIGFGTTAGPTHESTVDYTYDAYDRITQVIDSVSGTIAISFDDLARTASETTPQGTVGYSYDQVGRLTAKTVSGQSAISYGYDDANRLLTISQGLSSVNFTYDDANRRATLTLPNGIVAEYGYDAASQLTGITYKNGATVIGDLTYQYDQSGRRTKVGGSYARTGLPQPLSGATYNAANRLTQRGAASLTYDANGNLTNDGVNTYTWDARDQLAGISGSVTASFQYDAFGRRVQKTINGVATDYLYDGGNVVQEKMGGTPSANLLTGGIDEVFSRADTSATQSLLTDGLGSTVALLDSAGLPQTQYTYEPFGNTGTSGAASANSSQYTGRENDGTGLYYYRARYYSPTLQRFVSEDPAEFGGGDSNLYAYVSNSPCNFTDPSGELNPLVGACLGGAAFSVVDDLFSGRKPTLRSAAEGCLGGLLFFGAGRLAGPILRAAAPRLPRLPRVKPRAAGPGGPACFVAGTLVQTREGVKAIEEIAVGDEVLSYNEQTGRTEYKAITQTFVKQTDEVLYVTIVGEAAPLGTTREHPFFVHRTRNDTSDEGEEDGAWVPAGELRAGDRVRRPSGAWVRVTSVEQRHQVATVYNFEVAETHTYYVGRVGVLVHNHCAPRGKAPDQVTPGTRNVRGEYDPPTRSQPEPYSAHYDQYGRQTGRTDYTNQPDPRIHTNPHHHTREYGPGYGPRGIERGPFPGPHPLDRQ